MTTTGMFDERLKDKSYIQVLYTTKECPLLHTDLLVLSYLIYQDSYQRTPTHVEVARRTGLERHTVAASVERLRLHGLTQDGRIVIPSENQGWFQPASNKLGWRNWVCYLRAEESPLTVHAVSLLSHLWHCLTFKPKRWSVEYLAAVMSMNRATVESSLELLKKHRFVAVTFDPFRFQLGRLSEAHLAFLADKPKAAMSGDIEVVDLGEPESLPETPVCVSNDGSIPTTSEEIGGPTPLEVSKYLEELGYRGGGNHQIYRKLVGVKDWKSEVRRLKEITDGAKMEPRTNVATTY